MNASVSQIDDRHKCYFEFLDPLETYHYFKNNRENDKPNYAEIEKQKHQRKTIKLRIDLEKKEIFDHISELKD